LGEDVEQVRVFVPARRGDEATYVARGRFDPAKFLRAGGFTALPGEVFLHQRTGMLVAPSGDHLVCRADRGRIEAAREGAASAARNADLRRLLAEADQTATVWLAVVPPAMDAVPAMNKDAGMQNTLRFFVERSRSIRGGVHCGDDLELRLVLEGRNDRAVGEMVRQLKALQDGGRAMLKREVPADQRLWLTLLANLTWKRQGETVAV